MPLATLTRAVNLDVPRSDAPWSMAALIGRLVELSGNACVTLAAALILDAQRAGEPVAWVSGGGDIFFPPDMAANGIDLEALAVVRAPDPHSAARATDQLLRSGAFGLAVMDIGQRANIPAPLQSRLVQLARRHRATVVCLTEPPSTLGSLVSLRVHASRHRDSDATFHCRLLAQKDKHRGPGWAHVVCCYGPGGLC